MCKTLHIASVADEKYKGHLMAMIVSAMQSAGEDYTLVFHILGDGFTAETVTTYEDFIRGKGHEIHWLADTSGDVAIPITMYFSRAASLRLFLAEMVPSELDTILYLDSDTILCGNAVERFAQLNIGDKALGVVADADVIFKYMTRRTGITDMGYRYFNSGVLLINLKKWRAQNATQKHIETLTKWGEKLLYVDQDVLNICWKDDLCYLPLNFNVTSASYAFSPNFLAKRKGSPFYTAGEIRDATAHPLVLHFIGYTMDRPWKSACYHPLKQVYINAANLSPYGFTLEKSTPQETRKYTRMRWFRHVPAMIGRPIVDILGRARRKVIGALHG